MFTELLYLISHASLHLVLKVQQVPNETKQTNKKTKQKTKSQNRTQHKKTQSKAKKN